jgi:hypothetical protein
MTYVSQPLRRLVIERAGGCYCLFAKAQPR